ncbi:MAG: long-chain fatty acid--CoA ligase [Paludibacteraceae bacterium]|nr:long-chain fatty acid--CoA ligase [Paludibacteraceae bacterium]
MAVFLHSAEKTYSYEELMRYINTSSTYCPYFLSKDLYTYFANLIKALVTNQPVVLIDADSSPADMPYLDFALVNKPQEVGECSFKDMGELIEALCQSTSEITIFTSGTTGQPKRVVHSVATLARNVRRGEHYKEHVWAYAYNPTHMAGTQVFFQALMNQNTMVNVFGEPREVIYQQIERYGITHISATPTFYRMLMPFEKAYPSVKRVTLGGEKSDKQLYEHICKIFPNAKVNNVYASTEAGSLFAAKDDCFQIPANIRDKFRVENDELLIHKSLLGQSDSFAFDGEYYHSGDLIEWVNETEGLFRFKSRKNELINVGGYKVNPGEVEDAINAIEGVQQSLVYVRANSILGNIVVAEVKLVKGAALTDLEIRKVLASQLQDFKVPRKIQIVNELSMTRTGKLKRS